MRPKNPFPPEIRRLKAIQMRTVINGVRSLLWFDQDGKPAPNREWHPDTLAAIARVLGDNGLKPKAPKLAGTSDARS